MNIKSMYKFYLNDIKKGFTIYYFVILCILALSFIVNGLINAFAPESAEDFIFLGSVDAPALIFIFVVGLNSFKEQFKMALQNGVSRKTLAVSAFSFMLTLSAVMTFINQALILICNAIESVTNFSIHSTSYAYSIFPARFNGYENFGDALVKNLENIFFCFCAMAAAFAIGFLITSLYYFMNKSAKIIVSISIPVLCFMVYPIVDETIFNYRISIWLMKFLSNILGLSSQNAYRAAFAFLLLGAVCYLISFLLNRRAVIKQ